MNKNYFFLIILIFLSSCQNVKDALSGKKYENLFIEELIKKKVKYIIYNSPIYEVDNIKTSSRLRLVDAYLKNNYNFYIA